MATLEHVLTTGQSLSIGQFGTPPISTVAEVGNAFAVASNGVATAPLQAGAQQRPHYSMGYRIGAHRPAQAFGFSTHGLGGNTIAQLSPGGSSGKFEEAIAYVTAAHGVQVAASGTYHAEALHLIQGEQDQNVGTSQVAYAVAMAALHAAYLASIAAVTGQPALPLIASQVATWAYYNSPARIGLAQLDAARTQPDVYLACPQYQLSYYADGLHLDPAGYYHLGEFHARAHEAVITGPGWSPFAPTSTTVEGDEITIVFDVPTGPLVFDTTLIPAQTHMGFSLSGTAAQIVSVAITSADTVTITVDRPIFESAARVGYGVSANNASVGLGNLRDSETAVSAYDAAPLPNWAVHFNDSLNVDGVPPWAYTASAAYVLLGDGLHELKADSGLL